MNTARKLISAQENQISALASKLQIAGSFKSYEIAISSRGTDETLGCLAYTSATTCEIYIRRFISILSILPLLVEVIVVVVVEGSSSVGSGGECGIYHHFIRYSLKCQPVTRMKWKLAYCLS